MYPKFIIAGDVRDGRGYLRFGNVVNHSDLRIGYEKVWGGGWWEVHDDTGTVLLYGSSGDFGSPKFSHLKYVDRQWRGYRFEYTPVLGLPGNELDMTDVEFR